MKEKIKATKFNDYLIAEISFVIGLVLLLLLKFIPYKKIAVIVMAIAFIVGGIFSIIGVYGGRSFIRNKSNKKVWAKCKNDGTCFEIKKGKYKSNIDAIKVDNTVYKVCDGAKVTIKEDGSVSFGSFIFAPAFKCGVIETSPGEEWTELFSK